MNPKARKLLLQQILKAGDDLIHAGPGPLSFSCLALEAHGASPVDSAAYFQGLFSVSEPYGYMTLTARSRLHFTFPGEFISFKLVHDTQLMMLAWFHEMVRSEEFDQFL